MDIQYQHQYQYSISCIYNSNRQGIFSELYMFVDNSCCRDNLGLGELRSREARGTGSILEEPGTIARGTSPPSQGTAAPVNLDRSLWTWTWNPNASLFWEQSANRINWALLESGYCNSNHWARTPSTDKSISRTPVTVFKTIHSYLPAIVRSRNMAVCKICNKWKETVDSMVQHLMSEKPGHGVSWLQIQFYPAKYYELDPGMQVPRTPRPKRKREDADDDDTDNGGGGRSASSTTEGRVGDLSQVPTNDLLLEIARRCKWPLNTYLSPVCSLNKGGTTEIGFLLLIKGNSPVFQDCWLSGV